MNSVVVFYSWSGRTREMAEKIAAQTGAGVVEIEAETPYSDDYNTCTVEAKKEIQAGTVRPIKPVDADMSRYDVVYAGTPVWWGTMAPPLAAFLKNVDWQGKTVMPFSTHGGGGKGRTDADIKKACAGAAVKTMYTAFEGGGAAAEAEIAAWISKNI